MSESRPTGGEFRVEVRALDGVDHVVVHGELDLSSMDTLRQVVLDPAVCAQPVLLVDLEHTDFIDSSGVAGLVVCHRKTVSRDAQFVIACGDGFTLQVLTMVGLPRVLEIYPDAQAYLSARPQVCRQDGPGTMRPGRSSHLNG